MQTEAVPELCGDNKSEALTPVTKGKVAVIGAGPAGLSCALELLRAGYAVDIFELDDRVGGLARTVDVLEQKADLGSHRFFSKLDEVNNFWHQGMTADDFIVELLCDNLFCSRSRPNDIFFCVRATVLH